MGHPHLVRYSNRHGWVPKQVRTDCVVQPECREGASLANSLLLNGLMSWDGCVCGGFVECISLVFSG